MFERVTIKLRLIVQIEIIHCILFREPYFFKTCEKTAARNDSFLFESEFWSLIDQVWFKLPIRRLTHANKFYILAKCRQIQTIGQ